MSLFSTRDQDLCNYAGFFGILMSAISLIQHFTITQPGWLSGILACIYIFSIVSFALFAAQKPVSTILLIIVSALIIVSELVVLAHGLFSIILLLLCVYSMVITIYVFVDGIPGRLAQRAAAKRIEDQQWNGKI
jgi:hypothetical protein